MSAQSVETPALPIAVPGPRGALAQAQAVPPGPQGAPVAAQANPGPHGAPAQAQTVPANAGPTMPAAGRTGPAAVTAGAAVAAVVTAAGAGPAAAPAVTLARARWPAGPDDPLTQLPGFVVSSFSPAAAQAAQRCLCGFFGPPPAPHDLGERTGVVLASRTGDIATAAAVAAAVDEGRRVPPLLFFQSNPNAVVGFLTSRWGLAGPVVCTSPDGDVLADARRSAALLIAGGDAEAVLVITVTQASAPADTDHAEAELIGPRHWLPAAATTEPATTQPATTQPATTQPTTTKPTTTKPTTTKPTTTKPTTTKPTTTKPTTTEPTTTEQGGST
jgi:hypothetical protein